MAMIPIDPIMTWVRPDGVAITPTEHNRSSLSADPERIKSSDRMANGRLRQYYVADKRTWSVSWSMIPAPDSETVDKRAGAAAIEKFYYETPGEFDLQIFHKDGTLNYTARVVFDDYGKEHVKRGAYDFWNINVSLVEC